MTTRCRIATFNLENFGASIHDRDLFALRIDHFRERLLQIDADILCLQEVNADRASNSRRRVFPALDQLLKGTRFAGFEQSATVRPGSDEPADVHNLVTLSRWNIVAQRQVWHEFVPPFRAGDGLDAQWERPFLHTRIRLADSCEIDVVNLHLRAPSAAFFPGAKSGGAWRSSAAWAEGLFLSALKRDGQALEVRLFVETLFDAPPAAMVAVCGDFNAESRSSALRIIQTAAQDAGDPAFEARELTALEMRLPTAKRYSVLHEGARLLPDHILCSRALAACCVDVSILNAGLDDEAHPIEPIVGSLHAPLVADFEFAF